VRPCLVARERRSEMPELHPTQCACRDCRSRRLIRGDDVAAERNERAARLQATRKPLARAWKARDEVQAVVKP
jgi:hypothetical protein